MPREMKPLPDQAELLAQFSYDPETGIITRKDGARAFYSRTAGGYLKGKIRGCEYYAHRIAWKMHYGTDPAEIDHDNQRRDDNRIGNLVDGSGGRNERNSRLRKDSTSGYCGVVWNKRKNRWMAHIRVDGRQRFLGYFVSKEEAASVRKRASLANGFSERHGT